MTATSTSTQAQRTLLLGTPLGDDVLLVVSATITERLGAMFTCELELLSNEIDIDPLVLLGENVTLRAVDAVGTDADRLFNGVIARFAQVGIARNPKIDTEVTYARYSATLVPWAWMLGRGADCRIFQQKTLPNIVEEICTELGAGDVELRLSRTYPTLEYCVQYRETALYFILRLLEQEGITCFFEHEDGAHKMVLADDATSYVDAPAGVADLVYRPADEQGAASHGGYVRGFTRHSAVEPHEFALTDYDPLLPRKKLGVEVTGDPGHVDHGQSVFDYPGEYVELDHGQALAKVRLEESRARSVTFRGRADLGGLSAGRLITLGEHPCDAFNIKYLLTSVTTRLQSELAPSGYGAECQFTAIAADVAYRPARSTPKPIVQGPQTAVVVGPAGKELHVDEYGRVKVQFHWDRYGTSNENSSCWMRVATPIAGRNWGFAAWPRIGQEVIIEFLEGDPDRPMVTGCVYNGVNMPPYTLPDEVTKSTFKSYSTPGGDGFNEVRFEDKKGKEQVFVHSQRRMDIRVRANYYDTCGGNRETFVGYKEAGDHNLLVHKNSNRHVKADCFDLIDKNHTQIVVGEHEQKCDKNSKTYVKELWTLNAKECVVETSDKIDHKTGQVHIEGTRGVHILGGQVAIEAKGGPGTATIKALGVALDAATGMLLKSPMIKVDATGAISLKVGGSEVNISSAGVVITGPLVRINSGPGVPAVVTTSACAADAATAFAEFTPLKAIDAYAADSGKTGYGTGGGGGGGGRTNEPWPIDPNRAPPYLPPPPPPPPGGGGGPVIPPPGTDRAFLTIEWVEVTLWCSEPAHLRGTTRNYPDGTKENTGVRNADDGSVQTTLDITIAGNAFNEPVQIVDMLPRKVGLNFEESRYLIATAAGVTTPLPVPLKFIPTLPRTECSIGISHFFMKVENYDAIIEGAIKYVEGFMGWLIQLGTEADWWDFGQTGVNWGPLTPGSFSGNDWRFAKRDSSGKLVYWNGFKWKDVPATWSDPTNTRLYGIGIWREGSRNRAQFGPDWPETIPEWTAAQRTSAATTLTSWTTSINAKWTNKFDLKRIECLSTDVKCCRYKTKAQVAFTKVAALAAKVIVLGFNDTRSNAGAWSLAGNALMPAHEFGHHLGNPDEYTGGVGIDTSVNTDGATNGIDANSVMGQNMTVVKRRHYNTICQHLAAMVKTKTAKTYTYQAVAVA